MNYSQRFDIWVVAAAYLIAKGELHIRDLTTKIQLSDLSTLGLKQGKTCPRQTVGSRLSTRPEIFCNEPRGDGCWGVWNSDEALRHPEVALCCRLIAERRL